MLKVFGKAESINVAKVLWTLAELGIPFEREDWGSGHRSTQSPSFTALNPNAMVPVIVDGDFVLWESNSIIRYLAAAYDGQWLYPSEPRARAHVDQWIDWQASDLNSAWRYAFSALVRKDATCSDQASVDRSIAQWNTLMGHLDRQIVTTGAFVSGAGFSLADVVIGLSVLRWYSTPMDRPSLAGVAGYFERLSMRPAFRKHGIDSVK
jgi:glutathione S-transferase